MKKRILAMLLVLCMVMSVMPMTVLAAEADCPGKNKPHTLENCDATLVLSVAAATCLQQSYDLYTCDKCGVMFADNFGEYGPHNYEWPDEIPEEDRPSCGAGMVCVNENIYAESWLDGLCGDVLGHDFGCAGKCSCGLDGTPGHTWDPELIEITKEPEGCAVPGEATYNCAKCDATKVAPVYGKHIEKVAVEAVEPDCDSTGLLAHEYCGGCDTYWLNSVEVEKEAVVLAPKHTHLAGTHETVSLSKDCKVEGTKNVLRIGTEKAGWPATNGWIEALGEGTRVIIEIPAGASVTIARRNSNEATYFNSVFGEEDEAVVKIITIHAGDYINVYNPSETVAVDVKVSVLTEEDLELWVEPSCGGKGVYQVYCGEWDEDGALVAGCGALVTVETTTVAHDWILDEQKSQEPTCDRYGYEIWFCDICGEMKPIKKINKLPCVDTWAEVLAANKGKEADDEGYIWNEEELASCTQNGYRMWACPYCNEEFEQTLKATGCKLKTGTYPATKCTVGYTYRYCTNADCDNEIKHTPDTLEVSAIVGKCVHSYTTIKMNPAADHPWTLLSTTATCTEAGHEYYICTGCGEVKGPIAVKAYGHSGYDTVKDNDIPDLVVVEPTCWKLGESYYICADCGVKVQVTKDVPFVHKNMMTYEEAAKYHLSIPAYEDIVWIIEPTCEKIGYATIDCLNCKLNEVGSNKHSITIYAGGSHNFGDLTGKNCLSDPVPCLNGCGEYYTVDHAWSIPAVEATCENEGHSGYGVCSICGETREEPKVVYPSLHNFVADAAIVADCDSWGGQPATCPYCDASVITDYVPNLHYVNPALSDDNAIDNGGTVKKTQSGYLCQSDVKVTEDCVVDGCDYKKEYKLEAIGHHVNWWNFEIDPSKCIDCALKENNIVEFANWYAWYICKYCNEHVADNLGKDPTCTEEGYGVFAFTCGHSGYSSYLAPLNHKYPNGNAAWVENVDCGIYTCTECALCDVQKDLKSTGEVIISISDDTDKKVITDGSLITVTVDMSAYQTDLFGYSFDVVYLANVLEFVDYKVLTENFKYNALVHNNVELSEDLSVYDEKDNLVYGVYMGSVSVVGQSKTDGKNVKLTGTEDLVEITFKVINAEQMFKWATGEEEPPFAVVMAAHGNAALPFPVVVGEIEVVKNVINSKGKVTGVEYVPVIEYDEDDESWDDVLYIEHWIPVTRLMDADFNGEVNYKDAAVVWQMASGAIEYKYAEHLDLNGNGEIDHVDAKLIYQHFVGILAYEEVLNYEA